MSSAEPDTLSPYTSTQNRIQAIIQGRIHFNQNLSQVLQDPKVPVQEKKRLCCVTEKEYSLLGEQSIKAYILYTQNDIENYNRLLQLSELNTQNDVNLLLCMVHYFITFEDPIDPCKKALFKKMDYNEADYYYQIRNALIPHSDDEAVGFVGRSLQKAKSREFDGIGLVSASLSNKQPKAQGNFDFFFEKIKMNDDFYLEYDESMLFLNYQFGLFTKVKHFLMDKIKEEFSSSLEKDTSEFYQLAAAICLEIYGFDQKIKQIGHKSWKILQLISKKKEESEKQKLHEKKVKAQEERHKKSKASVTIDPSQPLFSPAVTSSVSNESSQPPTKNVTAEIVEKESPSLDSHLECSMETIRRVHAKGQSNLALRKIKPLPKTEREHVLLQIMQEKNPVKSVKLLSALDSFVKTQPLPTNLTVSEMREARQITNRQGSKRLAVFYNLNGLLSLCYFHELHRGHDHDIHPRDHLWKNIHDALKAIGYLPEEP